MKRYMIALMALFLTVACASASRSGWGPDKDSIVEMHADIFRKMPSEEVARYLVQRNVVPSTAVIRVLAERGESVMPLMKKLVKDEHPWIRRGAVKVLTKMHEGAREMTPALQAAADIVRPLYSDPHSEVQSAVRAFFGSNELFEEELYAEALKKAASPELALRAQALDIALRIKRRPDVAVEVAILACQEGNGLGQRRALSRIVRELGDHGQTALPTVNACLEKYAAGPKGIDLVSPLSIVTAFPRDPEAVKIVPSLCKIYTRRDAIHNESVREILRKIGKDAVPNIRQFVESEREFVQKAPDEVYGSKEMPYAKRENIEIRLRELEHVAKCLETGKRFSMAFQVDIAAAEEAAARDALLDISDEGSEIGIDTSVF